MNNSGQAVAAYLKNKELPLDHLVVIHDEVELPVGKVDLKLGGSAKGHNGVRSIQAALGTQDFYRLRLGVGRPSEGAALSDFVLEKFKSEEREAVEKMIQEAIQKLSQLAFDNPSPAKGGTPSPS